MCVIEVGIEKPEIGIRVEGERDGVKWLQGKMVAKQNLNTYRYIV